MERILLTAFEPFNKLQTNSSLEVLNKINRPYLIKEVLPVSYNDAKIMIKKLIEKYHPRFIINLGQAGGESKLRIEKFAMNYTRSNVSDNLGITKNVGRVFDGDFPLALETVINIESLIDEANSKNIDCYLSLSAGGFICNTVYYTSLLLNQRRALFIHLPYFSGQEVKDKTVDLSIIVKNTEFFIDNLYSKIEKR